MFERALPDRAAASDVEDWEAAQNCDLSVRNTDKRMLFPALIASIYKALEDLPDRAVVRIALGQELSSENLTQFRRGL
jgi:hypothetical protein